MAGMARNAHERAAKALGQFTGEMPLDVAGLGQLTFSGGNPQLALSPEQEALQGLFAQLGQQSGQGAMALQPGVQETGQQFLTSGQNLLAGADQFDPLSAAEARFQRLQSVLQPQREINRGVDEARLFRQGRLDSTSGARQLAESDRAIAGEDAMLFDRMFAESEQAQRGARSDALALGQAGTNVQGGLFSSLVGGQAGLQQGGQGLLQLLNAQNVLKATELDRLRSASDALGSFNTQSAKTGNSGLWSGLGTIAGGALGFAGGGFKGAMEGAKVGAGIGGMFG